MSELLERAAQSPGLRATGVRSEQAAVLEMLDVVRVFEGGVRALNSVSLRVASGEMVALSGPSGSGKSTLLHLVAAFDFPTSGTVMVGGRDIRKIRDLSRFRRHEVGIVFQLHNLLPQQPVIENVEVAMVGTPLSRSERRDRALELLAEVDLEGREHRRPTQLSGGERQRVAIARALANHPRLLLADEPTGSLDSGSATRVLELFHRVRETGVTVLLVTHDMSIAAAADRIVEMKDGRIVAGEAPARRTSGVP